MKGLMITVLCIGFLSHAEEQVERQPDATSDFSQDYLDQVRTEREKHQASIEPSNEELRRDHQKYLRELARSRR